MKRKLIIDGNAVYEIDENCMLKNSWTKRRKRKTEKRSGRKKPGIKNSPADCRGVLRSKAD